MYYSRKKPQAELPTEMTDIWSCVNEDCNGWMRKNFALDKEPVCFLCQSPMKHDTRELPMLNESGSAVQVVNKPESKDE
ncbi:cold-shock protein [Paenibacillus pasadenensis]|uniref:cold-shock protein n=1 Tax=Paenibacillus pasadenensis TaxID=217090 RepID=UPI00203E2BFE|nr:cold-shock protein [Paenibacillus pasadenensis]MCM3749406.1 cold-shock protein [Paenibacillus pasadenensis]